MSKPVILTGLRANNDLHLGNYLGGLQPIVGLQRQYAGEYQINLFVPDLHSFTTPIDHSQLYDQVMNNLRLFVAAGLDPSNEDTYIYRQSYIPAHSELAWILDCFTYMGEMSRMTQYKDKANFLEIEVSLQKQVSEIATTYTANKGLDPEQADKVIKYILLREEYRDKNYAKRQSISIGLFNYPVLMVADILLYGAQYVPLGEDQDQHIEFTRDIAMRLNEKFKATHPNGLFALPFEIAKQRAFRNQSEGIRIRDLIDPTKKMSKSDESGKGVVFLGDSPETAAKKIMGAATDSLAEIRFDMKERAGVSNLLQILAYLTQRPVLEVVQEYEGQTQYGPLKEATAAAVRDFLSDFQAKLAQVDDSALLAKLEASEAVMNEQANTTLLRVQRAVGLRVKKGVVGKQRASTAAKPDNISFDDFSKLNMKIGTVLNASAVENSDKLIELKVNLGDESRTIITGMREFHEPSYFVGKQLPILANLKPQTFRNKTSYGMLIAVEGQDGPVLLVPEQEVVPGSPLE
jgi:tryptophanyl-tRNA synthetase